MIASDVNNPNFVGAIDPDSVMIARFYKKAIKQVFLSEKEGRPIFEDVIYCEYYPAGSTLLKMDVPAQDSHKQRFSKQWAYYQSTQGGDSREVGTPLSEWPLLSPADVENLRGAKFNTVENIAGASDAMLQSIPGGTGGMAPHILRARAQGFLGAAQDTALPQKQAAEIAELKKSLEEMRQLIEVANVTKPKGKRVWTDEQKQAMSERMKKARESKGKQHGVNTTPAS